MNNIRPIRKLGNSLGLTIPNEICIKSGIKDGSLVSVEQNERGITLIPVEVSPKNN